MRVLGVIFVAPILSRKSRFKDRSKTIGHQQLVSNARIERLDESVLSGLSRLNEEQLDVVIMSPNFEGRSNKLGAVVHAQATRISVLTSGLLQRANDRRARIRKLGLHCQRVSTAFIEQRQSAEDATVQQLT